MTATEPAGVVGIRAVDADYSARYRRCNHCSREVEVGCWCTCPTATMRRETFEARQRDYEAQVARMTAEGGASR